MSLKLQPLLKWPGGKARMAKQLSRMLPPHSTYVEPFAGGAAVFFHKPLVDVNVIGDHDKWLADFYQQTRMGGLRRCRGGIKKSKGLFDRSKKQNGACYKVARTSLSFHGDRSTYVGEGATAKAGSVMHRNKLKRYKDYEKKLRKSHIYQGDFAAVMRKHDSPSTLHFLDPPWPIEYSDVLYKGGAKTRVRGNKGGGLAKKGTAFDPVHVKKVSKSMQGHVFIIINNSKKLRETFCADPAFQCKVKKVMTNMGRGMVLKENLIIQKPARRGQRKSPRSRTQLRGARRSLGARPQAPKMAVVAIAPQKAKIQRIQIISP
jgi:site-specific DNA-adenine methylase